LKLADENDREGHDEGSARNLLLASRLFCCGLNAALLLLLASVANVAGA
jgi:hypothetical protein